MPEISRFFGIIIRMYWEMNAPHHLPHFHAYYQDDVAVFSIDPVELGRRRDAEASNSFGRSVGRIASNRIGGGLGSFAEWKGFVADSTLAIDRGDVVEHKIYRVESFEIVGPFRLKVTFDDDADQTIDFRPIIAGEMYEALGDLDFFNRVTIDPEVHTLVWPNGADFDPATLHDWNSNIDAIRSSVAQWNVVPA